MILPKAQDALHKAMMYRLLSEMLDDRFISQKIFFKGGTCAAALGWLDRFSLDLDFDLAKDTGRKSLRKKLEELFSRTGFIINQKYQKQLFYILKYQAQEGQRNTLKISIVDQQYQSNLYDVYVLPEIDRLARCQTRETMFAHKLVATTDRYAKYHTIAGRDIYDLWYFFSRGFGYRSQVIEQRCGKKARVYLKELADFIRIKVTEKIISQDLNCLLPPKSYQAIRKTLKTQLLIFLSDEISRLE